MLTSQKRGNPITRRHTHVSCLRTSSIAYFSLQQSNLLTPDKKQKYDHENTKPCYTAHFRRILRRNTKYELFVNRVTLMICQNP